MYHPETISALARIRMDEAQHDADRQRLIREAGIDFGDPARSTASASAIASRGCSAPAGPRAPRGPHRPARDAAHAAAPPGSRGPGTGTAPSSRRCGSPLTAPPIAQSVRAAEATCPRRKAQQEIGRASADPNCPEAVTAEPGRLPQGPRGRGHQHRGRERQQRGVGGRVRVRSGGRPGAGRDGRPEGRATTSPASLEPKRCLLEDTPGQLLACITDAIEANQGSGRVIKDILVGANREDGKVVVQVYSEGPGDRPEEAPGDST